LGIFTNLCDIQCLIPDESFEFQKQRLSLAEPAQDSHRVTKPLRNNFTISNQSNMIRRKAVFEAVRFVYSSWVVCSDSVEQI
jgi:hypothetical protein